MNEKVVSASLLSATQAVAVFTAVMPPMHMVRRTSGNQTTIQDTRTAEKAGTVIVVSVGLLASYLVRDPTPAMIAVIVAGAMTVMYEQILMNTPKETKNV